MGLARHIYFFSFACTLLCLILSSNYSVLLVFDLLSKSSASKLEGCYNFIVHLYRMNAVLKDGDQCGYLQDCS